MIGCRNLADIRDDAITSPLQGQTITREGRTLRTSESSNFAASHVIGNIFSRLRTAASAEKQSAAVHDISTKK